MHTDTTITIEHGDSLVTLPRDLAEMLYEHLTRTMVDTVARAAAPKNTASVYDILCEFEPYANLHTALNLALNMPGQIYTAICGECDCPLVSCMH